MISPDLQTAGKLMLDVSAGGTIESPGMHGQIRVENATFATEAAPIGIQNLNAVMQVSDTGVQVTDAAGNLGGGQVKFGGSLIYRPQLQANLTLSGKSVRLRYPDGMRTSSTALTRLQFPVIHLSRALIDSLSFTWTSPWASSPSHFSSHRQSLPIT
jgi:translocation and assembly module TamB